MNIPKSITKSWWKIVTNTKDGDVFYIKAVFVSHDSETVIADGVEIKISGGTVLEVEPVEGFNQ